MAAPTGRSNQVFTGGVVRVPCYRLSVYRERTRTVGNERGDWTSGTRYYYLISNNIIILFPERLVNNRAIPIEIKIIPCYSTYTIRLNFHWDNLPKLKDNIVTDIMM